MAELQTSYPDGGQWLRGAPGQVEAGTVSLASRTAESEVMFGRAVFAGSAARMCTATPTAGKFLGIAVQDEAQALLGNQDADSYDPYETVAYALRGKVLAVAGEDVTKGDPVFITGDGELVKTAGGNIATGGWQFDATALSGDLVNLTKD